MHAKKYYLFCFALLWSTLHVYAQWSEHRTPVGRPVSSLAFVGDRIFAQWQYPGSQAFGSVISQDGAAWETFSVPADPLCPGGNCGPKNLFSENGHLYYADTEWPGFIYKSDDGGDTWTNSFPPFSDFSEMLFAGDHIFVTYSNVLWRTNSDGSASFNSFSSTSNWPIAGLCRRGNQLLLLDGTGLWVSENTGDTWTQVTDAVTAINLSYENTALFAFGESIFVSVRDQGLHVSTDDGETWNLLPFPGEPFISCMIEYDGELFCGDGKSLFSSDDGGMNWLREVLAPGPDFLVRNGNDLWMATDFGPFQSQDGGKNWYAHNEGLHRQLYGFTPDAPTVNRALFSHAGRLFLSTEFGLFDTSDDGDTWHYAGNFTEISGGISGDSTVAIREDFQWGYHWYYSRDTAQTWLPFPLPPNAPASYNRLLYVNGDWFAFVNQSAYKTGNYGQNWEQLPITFTGITWDAVFSQGKIFVASHNGSAISSDLGMTWTTQPLPGVADFQLFANSEQVYASLASTYYRYDTDHWEPLESMAFYPGNYKFAVGENAVFAYDVASQFNHNLLLSVDNGENWTNLIHDQPFLTDRIFDVGALAFGLHDNNFYAFGKSAGDQTVPALWKLDTGEADTLIRPGKVFFDIDGDGLPGGAPPGIPNIVVSTPAVQAITNPLGDFAVYGAAVGDTLRPYLVNPDWISNPPFHVVEAVPKPYFFAITPANDPDLVVTATAVAPFRPGFASAVKIRVINQGGVNSTGVLRFVKPANLSVSDVSPTEDLIDADTIFWNIDLPPFITRDYEVLLDVPATVQIGDLLSFFAEAIPDLPDSEPSDNAASFTETVVGAFDPNDKLVDPVRITTTTAAEGTWLDYTIRFQNTGNAPATLVRITDTLSEWLDLRSVQVLGASHPCIYEFREGRVLEATFHPIFLPHTLFDEPGSHGFVRFAIRLLPGLAVADTVRNAADIVFDFNAPIRTPATKTWVEAPIVATAEVNTRRQLLLFPNPTTGHCTILLPDGFSAQDARLYLTDLTGRVVHSLPFAASFHADALPPGMYFITLKNADGKQATGKLIRQKP